MCTLQNPGTCSNISHLGGKRLISLTYRENVTFHDSISARARQFDSIGSSCASLGNLPKYVFF